MSSIGIFGALMWPLSGDVNEVAEMREWCDEAWLSLSSFLPSMSIFCWLTPLALSKSLDLLKGGRSRGGFCIVYKDEAYVIPLASSFR